MILILMKWFGCIGIHFSLCSLFKASFEIDYVTWGQTVNHTASNIQSWLLTTQSWLCNLWSYYCRNWWSRSQLYSVITLYYIQPLFHVTDMIHLYVCTCVCHNAWVKYCVFIHAASCTSYMYIYLIHGDVYSLLIVVMNICCWHKNRTEHFSRVKHYNVWLPLGDYPIHRLSLCKRLLDTKPLALFLYTLDLIEIKTIGIMDLLDEEC